MCHAVRWEIKCLSNYMGAMIIKSGGGEEEWPVTYTTEMEIGGPVLTSVVICHQSELNMFAH